MNIEKLQFILKNNVLIIWKWHQKKYLSINLGNLPRPSAYCLTPPAFLTLRNKIEVIEEEKWVLASYEAGQDGRGDEVREEGVSMTVDNRRGRRGRKRSVEKKRSGSWDKMRGETRGGDVSLLLLSATGFSVYQFGLHTPASEISCSHFGLHSLDVCYLFTTKSCHSWGVF